MTNEQKFVRHVRVWDLWFFLIGQDLWTDQVSPKYLRDVVLGQIWIQRPKPRPVGTYGPTGMDWPGRAGWVSPDLGWDVSLAPQMALGRPSPD